MAETFNLDVMDRLLAKVQHHHRPHRPHHHHHRPHHHHHRPHHHQHHHHHHFHQHHHLVKPGFTNDK